MNCLIIIYQQIELLFHRLSIKQIHQLSASIHNFQSHIPKYPVDVLNPLGIEWLRLNQKCLIRQQLPLAMNKLQSRQHFQIDCLVNMSNQFLYKNQDILTCIVFLHFRILLQMLICRFHQIP